MFILADRWRDGFLDYHLPADQVRIRVRCYWPLQRLADTQLAQPRSLRRLLAYVVEVGPRNTARKVRSRLKERARNEQFLAVGIGEIVEGRAADLVPGDGVIFVAPCHPRAVERIVLPAELVARAPSGLLQRYRGSEDVHLCTRPPDRNADAGDIAGWSPFSAEAIGGRAAPLLEWATGALARLDPAGLRKLPLSPPSPVRERSPRAQGSERPSKTAVLFGLGHYAKTNVLPNIDPRIQVRAIHEIDPTQIGPVPSAGPAHDTSATPRPDEDYDVYLIAGYHATHAGLAAHAIRRGGYAVVEKPLVTTRAQLDDLLAACRAHPGRLFGCFHMRYNPLWGLARADLKLRPGEPVHYSCVVYEIPLARKHWYEWPSSRSRIVSNGCHWLDHFLFMNGFSPPVRRHLWRGANGDFHVSVELANRAVFSMVLTDIGSRRIGVQDHIQLRAGGITVRVDNGSRYMAEDNDRVLRVARINKMESYATMYRSISEKILRNEPADPIEWIERSTSLMLDLEDLVEPATAAASGRPSAAAASASGRAGAAP
ncbi:oxidoreductase [Sorangium cellulosum]|uniref:Oxidoreductase n=1 Tax=Sorangium cellulosum TaxID=56 RepID=A0A4P2Q8J4_SORCE|nr:Gfo/Idh/MocA family oxidoreductase [Sorangium cellulosum]AUX25526.1 oxidoreductase [Sorangium cellulosum]